MTKPDLAAMRKRCNEATSGPWSREMLTIHARARIPDGPTEQYQVIESEFVGKSYVDQFLRVICEFSCTRGKYEIEERNAEFVAYARTDLPAALDYIEQLETELAKLRLGARHDSQSQIR